MYVMIRVQWTCTEQINLIRTLGAAPQNNTHNTENINHCTNSKLLLWGSSCNSNKVRPYGICNPHYYSCKLFRTVMQSDMTTDVVKYCTVNIK